ncbi:sensor domain-containing diguanylate cyclase [Plasticicumulans acidivorans]|uniref:PAS domain S-box-containing protein n=1 Tax=Plasticicumulans acidivorans TaxID=886464 RepID=A0A317MT45_9GAMM|nr:PAS domain S-box protein [Plasticicumulans acidivorans]PWV60563.1 PAS domain S-box-containing protein [Plasticicumulans acidivorans]
MRIWGQSETSSRATEAAAGERRAWLWPLVCLCVGGLLSAVLFVWLAGSERARARDAFEHDARDRFLAVARELEQGLTALQGLAAYSFTTPTVPRDGFEALSRPLLSLSAGIDSLGWAVRSGDSFVLQRVYPGEGAALALGGDLGARAELADTVAAARDGGRLMLSDVFVYGDAQQRGVLAVQPVYRSLQALSDERRRASEIIGVAVAVIDPQRLVESALSRLDMSRIELRLFDPSAPKGRQLLYHPLGSLRGAAMASYLTDLDALSVLEHEERDIEVAQRRWKLVATPAPGQFISSIGERPWWGLLAGLALSAAVSAILYGVIGRQGSIETLVARRNLQLAESERRLRQIIESSDGVFWVCSADARQLLYLSPAFESVWGYPVEAFFSRPNLRRDSIHPEDRERVRRALMLAPQSGGFDIEYRIVRADGAQRWLRDRARVVRDTSGVPLRIVGHAEDMTERRWQASIVSEHEQWLQALYESLPEALLTLADNGVIEALNPAAERLFGVMAAEVCGQPVSRLLTDFDPLQPPLDGRPVPGLRRNGARFSAKVNVAAVEALDGTLHYACLVHDLTALTQAQSVSARERERSEAILASIGEAVITTDSVGRVDFLSPLAQRLTGWEPTAAVGRPLPEIVPLRHPQTGADLLAQAHDTREDFAPGRLRRCDGSELDVLCSIASIRRLGQDIGGVVLVLREQEAAPAPVSNAGQLSTMAVPAAVVSAPPPLVVPALPLPESRTEASPPPEPPATVIKVPRAATNEEGGGMTEPKLTLAPATSYMESLPASDMPLLINPELPHPLAAPAPAVAEASAVPVAAEQAADVDPYTALPDRPAFIAQLDGVLAGVRNRGPARALAYLSLTRLARLEVLGGMELVDMARQRCVLALAALLGPQDRLARVGSDEFAVLYADWAEDSANTRKEAIRAAVAGVRVEAQGRSLPIGGNVGLIRLGDDNAADALDALAAAELACQQAASQRAQA